MKNNNQINEYELKEYLKNDLIVLRTLVTISNSEKLKDKIYFGTTLEDIIIDYSIELNLDILEDPIYSIIFENLEKAWSSSLIKYHLTEWNSCSNTAIDILTQLEVNQIIKLENREHFLNYADQYYLNTIDYIDFSFVAAQVTKKYTESDIFNKISKLENNTYFNIYPRYIDSCSYYTNLESFLNDLAIHEITYSMLIYTDNVTYENIEQFDWSNCSDVYKEHPYLSQDIDNNFWYYGYGDYNIDNYYIYIFKDKYSDNIFCMLSVNNSNNIILEYTGDLDYLESVLNCLTIQINNTVAIDLNSNNYLFIYYHNHKNNQIYYIDPEDGYFEPYNMEDQINLDNILKQPYILNGFEY